MFCKKGDIKLAKSCAEKAVEIDPNSALAKDALRDIEQKGFID
jgi:Tfp pilus assembly protein PilF